MLGVEGTGSAWMWPEQWERATIVLGETEPRNPGQAPHLSLGSLSEGSGLP